jgi:hypothetical protein
MSIFNQDTVYSNLLRGMKRGRSLTKELKHMPAAIKVRKDENGKVMVRYYDTDIVTVEGDRVTLNNGGWPTPSTRRYINAALATLFPGMRLNLNQSKGDQFFNYYELVVPFYRNLTFNIGADSALQIFTN